MKTYSMKAGDISRDWYIIDATDKTLGRLASGIASRLRGKHKPEYTPHMDTGDYIVVINTAHVAVTGNKLKNKMYHKHTGYVGNLKSTSLSEMLQKDPVKVLSLAVKGMMPRNPLGRQMQRKLKIYADDKHQHDAQRPIELNI